MIYHEKVYNDIINDFFDAGIIKKGDNLIVALSGGIDSMCLLDIFYKLKPEFGYRLYAIHVHHGIRGIEADRDLNFVKKYCESLKVKLFLSYVNAPELSLKKKISIEEAARVLRYDAFEQIYKSFKDKKNTYILVAHHEQDQVETIIHNMIRGTGVKGLGGMKQVSGYILRPLLYTSKDLINDYVKLYNIPYVEDSTNSDKKYTRNYIRDEIVAKLPSINEKAYKHIVDLSNQAILVSDYIDSVSKFIYANIKEKEEKDNIVLDLTKFNNLTELFKSNVIKIVIKKLSNSLKDIGKVHIDSVITFSSKMDGGHIDLPYNITYDKKGKKMIFKHNRENISINRRKKL